MFRFIKFRYQKDRAHGNSSKTEKKLINSSQEQSYKLKGFFAVKNKSFHGFVS
jgi:hypothetical protein